MTKRNIRSNQTITNPPKVSWTEFFDFLKNTKEKVGWMITGIVAIFLAGFAVGKFYEGLMNKFEVLELQRKHSDEIQKINQEHNKEVLADMKEVQNKIEKASNAGKEDKNEK